MDAINGMAWAVVFLAYTYRGELSKFERKYSEAVREKAERQNKAKR